MGRRTPERLRLPRRTRWPPPVHADPRRERGEVAIAAPILIFGGTFDPPHRAHIELPPLVAKQIGAGRTIFVPTSLNPLKDERPTPAVHRLAMLRLGLEGVDGAEIDTTELDEQDAAYTVDTLERLHDRLGADTDLRLLMGADTALGFHRWKSPERILELATPVVMLRPPRDEAAFRREMAGHQAVEIVDRWLFWMIPLPLIDVSATEVRRRIAGGEPLDDLVPQAVAAYIREHALYTTYHPR